MLERTVARHFHVLRESGADGSLADKFSGAYKPADLVRKLRQTLRQPGIDTRGIR